MDRSVEETDNMINTEISDAIRKAGMLYFEYDPIHHTATRPDNILEDGMPDTLDNYPECIIERSVINPVQAERFREAFQRIDKGSRHESFEVEICMRGQLYWYQYHIVANPNAPEKRAICIACDNTEKHLQSVMEELLLTNQFESVCVIDSIEKNYMVRFSNEKIPTGRKAQEGYEDGCQKVAMRYVIKAERGLFMQKTSLDAIRAGLQTNEKYSFIMNGVNEDRKRQMHQYSFSYMDGGERMILATLSDVTKIMDHDVLTGEYNRNGFDTYVTEFLNNCEDRTKYAILFYNIKGFKAINDLLGEEGGDQILRESVDIFRNSFLNPLAICRLEADHFVIFTEKDHVDYDKLGELCKRAFTSNGKTINFYGRFGIYLLKEIEHDVNGMCDRARMAKKFIKDDYVKPYCIYDDSMRESFTKKRDLLNALDKGVSNEEFTVFYQPIFDAVSGEIVSAEALVRWIHPEYGMISPGEFIPVFEENGHISQLDLLVEDNVKDFILERINQNKHMVPIAINLSRMDFYDHSFMKKIMKDIREIKQLDSFCRLEITESAYSALIDQAVEYVRSFKEYGVKILLDDFGSGYSSFSTIRQFDFDILKLDMGFIQSISESEKTESIIKNMIGMAHDLNLQVIAEGVETEQQKQFLLEQKCDYMQGYLYSKPLPKEGFIKLLDQKEKDY